MQYSKAELVRYRCVLLLFVLAFSAFVRAQEDVPTPPIVDDSHLSPGYLGFGRTSQGEPKHRISGRVLNSATGSPIARAVVMLNARVATMSDGSGAFEFNGVPEGQYWLSAEKPGYFAESFRSSERSVRTVQVDSNDAASDLKLIPEAVVTGKCLDEDGMPVARMQVHLAMRSVVSGHAHWQALSSVFADRNGHYRIGSIRPGRYLLIAGPTISPMAVVGGAAAFPATYFGGNTSGFAITPGEHLEANFDLNAKHLFKFGGTVTGPGNKSARLIALAPGQQEHDLPMEGDRIRPGTLPPGEYKILAIGQDGDQRYQAAAIVTIDRDLTDLSLTLQPEISIPIQVKGELPKSEDAEEDDEAPEGPLALVPVEGEEQFVVGHGALKLFPGEYTAMSSFDPRYYIASAQMGSIDLLTQNVTIESPSHSMPLQLEIKNDGAMLRVQIDGTSFPGASLLIIPDRGHPVVYPYFNSNMEIGQLAPGSYQLLAFEDVSDLAYLDSGELEPYLDKAVKIELSPNQHATVKLSVTAREAE